MCKFKQVIIIYIICPCINSPIPFVTYKNGNTIQLPPERQGYPRTRVFVYPNECWYSASERPVQRHSANNNGNGGRSGGQR